jgi:nitrate/nitrite transporter NarK
MTFGIVPYVDPANLGAVCGVVGAWGNIGAVIFSWRFREFYSEQARFESSDDDDDVLCTTTTFYHHHP